MTFYFLFDLWHQLRNMKGSIPLFIKYPLFQNLKKKKKEYLASVIVLGVITNNESMNLDLTSLDLAFR